MWPSNGSPGGSVINYGGPSLGINLINGVMLPICNIFEDVCPTDLTLRTNSASSHPVLNITGYFSPEPIKALECRIEQTLITIGNSAFNFASPSCPEGWSLTGGGHNWTGHPSDVWFWELSPEEGHYRCRGTNNNATASNITCFALC